MAKVSSEVSAARALLAHYNSQIAGRLVQRLLKQENPKVWEKLLKAILDTIPVAVEKTLWTQIVEYVTMASEDYLGGNDFITKVNAVVATRADALMAIALDDLIKEKVRAHIANLMKSYDMKPALAGVLGKLQAAMDEEIKVAAKAEVQNAAAKIATVTARVELAGPYHCATCGWQANNLKDGLVPEHSRSVQGRSFHCPGTDRGPRES